MKVGIALDGVFCDTQTLFNEWYQRDGDLKFRNDMAFWAALKAYDDVAEAIALIRHHDIYVFAERPKAVFMPTRAWLRNNVGLGLNKDRIIMQALKRYDARLHGIDVFIDSDKDALENLKIETVHPIQGYLVDRDIGPRLSDVAREINESFCF